ncbi:MAG: HAD-IIB family hydrolase [Treponema sp.]|nr:HAD-IIB family hydrolase [Treponema sp.]
MKMIGHLSPAEAAGIKYVLMDIDDTLTSKGKLPALSYEALWKLKEAGLKVIPVTGRPAGWCDLIAREWPTDGVIGENGALAFFEEAGNGPENLPVLKAEYHPNAIRNDHPVLAGVKERAFKEFPEIRLAKDQFSRLFDIAFDFAEEEPVLPLDTAIRIKTMAEEAGAKAKISSIHINVWMGNYDKLSMAENFLSKHFGWNGDTTKVFFVGDSPNDEPMFTRFPLSSAVANIRRYEGLIKNLPAYVASKESGGGFAEIANTLLEKK